MSKKIFITGAQGFIGKHVINLLKEKKYILYCLSRNPSLSDSENAKWISGDLKNIEEHEQEINQCDVILHLASEIKDVNQMDAVNVEALKKMLNLLKPGNIKGFLYLSSAGIYGIRRHPEKNITENSACFPLNKYEETKMDAEKYLQWYAEQNNLPFTILRPTNVVGEFDTQKKLLNLCSALTKRRFLILKKDAIVNYVYAGDIASVIMQIIEKDDFRNETYNLNSPLNIQSFTAIMQKALKINSPTSVLPGFLRPFILLASKIADILPSRFRFIDSDKYAELTNLKVISNQKAQEHFGHLSSADFETGMVNLINYYQEKRWL